MQDHPAGDFSLFDLVIVDEAHAARNAETANYHFVEAVRDAAASLVMLTATPLQTHSENLFNLLRLVDPDRFVSLETFEQARQANTPIIESLNALLRTPPDREAFHRHLQGPRAFQSSASRASIHARHWPHPNIDVVGIDAYFPLTDVPRAISDKAAIGAGWASGELIDYFYATQADRDLERRGFDPQRSPIDEEPDFDPAEIAALVPPDRFAEFSYASELVTHDGAIGALLSSAEALRKTKDRLPGPWAQTASSGKSTFAPPRSW